MDFESREISEQTANYGKILFKEESYAIQGAIFEVYRVMGCGFLEAVYQECLEKELQKCQIPYESQVELPLCYKEETLTQTYRADFVCFEKILVEIKAIKDLGDEHRAQVLNYLKITGYPLGLLVNFGHFPKVAIERILL